MNRITILLPLLFFLLSCNNDKDNGAPVITDRTALPVLKSQAVSTLISDSGVVSYKIIAEDWFIYDQTTPTYWSLEKGMFIEKYNKQHEVEAYISCDTAYYFDADRLWELRGRVLVRNIKGETFKTSLLYWNQVEHQIYSDRYMEIDGIDQDLSGYDFRSNESLTQYTIHKSVGAFPMSEEDEDTTSVSKTSADSLQHPHQQTQPQPVRYKQPAPITLPKNMPAPTRIEAPKDEEQRIVRPALRRR